MVNNRKFLQALKILFLSTIVIFGGSCQRLDDNLFNPTKTTDYLLEDYTGEEDFKLDESYKIDPSLIYKFALASRTKDDTYDVYLRSIYIGDLGSIKNDTVILYCHGNKGNMDFYWQRAKLLANIGGKNRYGVLMFDYRGFGGSQGKSTEQTLYADVDAALRWLRSYGLKGTNLIVYGFSLGSVPAVDICYKSRILSPKKIILEAPIASSYNMVEGSAKLNMPASYYTNHKINNAKKMKSVIQPFMWIHGEDDDFLSMKNQGKVVYDNYRGTYSESHIIEKANHSNVPNTWGFDNYKNNIYNFIVAPK